MGNIFKLVGLDTNALSKNLPKVDATHASLANILTILYVIAGALAVVFIIVGAIRYILSAGESARISSAKNTILYAVVGLIVVIMAVPITNFVLGNLDVSTWQNLRDSVINTLLYVAGIFAVIMIIYGGFRYVTAGGNPTAITAAKNTILFSVIGLVVAILAFAVVNFVLGAL